MSYSARAEGLVNMISHLFALSLNVKQFYSTVSGATTPVQREPGCDGNEGKLHSPKFQHYWSFPIRLFNVISRKLVEGGGITPLQRCSRFILWPQLTGLFYFLFSSTGLYHFSSINLYFILYCISSFIIKTCQQHGFPWLSCHLSLSAIILGKSSRWYPVSVQSRWM